MNKEELSGLKYFIGYCIVVVGFFWYSGIVGYKWFNPTQTEPTHTTGGTHVRGHRFYHK